MIQYTIMSAIKIYSNDSLLNGYVGSYRLGRGALPHMTHFELAAIKSRFSADMLSLRM